MLISSKLAPQYIPAARPSKVTKAGVRIISEMSTPRILAFVAMKHRVGLLLLSTLGMFGYFVVYDKFVRIFF